MFKKALAGALVCLFAFGGVASADTIKTHTVKAGETFGAIARTYSVSMTRLAEANPQVKNINMIMVGQRLNLPTADWEKTADSIINLGKSYWGTPYVYGAQRFQDKSFDCSSFVQWLFSKHGISLGWNAREQAVQGQWIPFDQIRKGDVLFFEDTAFPNETGLNKARHVGIYMGDGKILHTYIEGVGVTISTFHNDPLEGEYWYQHYLFAKRLL